MDQPDNLAVILCAVAVEYEAAQSYFKRKEVLLSKGATGYKSEFNGSSVVVLRLQKMGTNSAAIETQRAIDVWRPQFLLLIGITGGYTKKDRYLGDVIVADQIVAYELGKQSDEKRSIRPEVFRTSPTLISAAQSVAQKPYSWVDAIQAPRPDQTTNRVIPKVHVGPVLSGDKVVASNNFLQEFRSAWSDILGVEMEGAGAGLAVYRSETQPQFLLIKAICDWADNSKDDRWQNYAAHVSAAFASRLLMTAMKDGSIPSNGYRNPQRKRQGTCTHHERWEICNRLSDQWEDVANYYQIARRARARFRVGSEMFEIWDWLVARAMLDSLPTALSILNRVDIIKEFPCLTGSKA